MADGKVLSALQRRQFDADGYVLVENMLSAEDIKRYTGRAREIALGDYPAAAKSRLVRDVRIAKGLVPEPADRELGLWKLMNPDRFDDTFRAFLETPRLLDAFEDILGEDILAFLLMLIYKPPGLEEAVHPFHQDAFYFPFGPHDLCAAAWLALDDADADNGGLTVVPGSHKGPVAEHRVPDGVHNFGNFEIPGADAHPDAITLSVTAGDAVFFHSRTWHKTAGNRTQRSRRVITVHAASAACRPSGSNFPHEEFGMRLVRGRLHEGGLRPLADAALGLRTRSQASAQALAAARNEQANS